MALSIDKLRPTTAEVDGVWCAFSEADDCHVKLARYGNPKHIRMIRKLSKNASAAPRRQLPWHDGKSSAQEEDREMHAIEIKSMACCVLLDWKGFAEESGEEIPYSATKAESMLLEFEYFYSEILRMSVEFADEHQKATEYDEGNSNGASIGT